MKKQIKMSEAVGLKLEGFACSSLNGQIALVLEGDRMAIVYVHPLGYDMDGVNFQPDAVFEPFDFGDKALADAGICTEDELNCLRDEAREKAKARQLKEQEAMQAEYLRLKSKFKGKSKR